ncbi:hypothetical protein [Streptomyces cavernicola]|uniref:Uncharacterized protein n=1 Tax=Streptomyces cavernicola TaxID=3043613 RepID=A0ABT6SC99_9ACTN|nr:hypothetical protein [Streptomyces sp. B-S-A6]MDI3405585.1 hypothetical protein [Streptomyces sp. B-S-A6]
MADGDMRKGRCGVCGGGEVYWGEYVAQAGIRPPGASSLRARNPVFDAYVCAACGHTQLHVRLDAKMASFVRRRLNRVPPQQG